LKFCLHTGHSSVLADKKVLEIERKYKLSFPDGLDLQTLVREHKKAATKLQKMDEIGEISQEKVVEYADEMQLELMTDDNGAIIIMDGNDLDMFVNLINEDYILSEITGRRYEIKSKKYKVFIVMLILLFGYGVYWYFYKSSFYLAVTDYSKTQWRTFMVRKLQGIFQSFG